MQREQDKILDNRAEVGMVKESKRLAVLQSSLEKKRALLDAAFASHFADVRSANGQPLNDKTNGRATLNRWERGEERIRRAQAEIARTIEAIEREKRKCASVAVADDTLPRWLLAARDRGEIVQWRRHPETFFVPGVEKGRIAWSQGKLVARYVREIPTDQYPKFRDAFNALNALSNTQVLPT